MPQIPIIMPQLGESIAEATIINFLVKPGDHVEADQDIIEVETNKATMNVASPCRGRIEKFTAQLNESYPVGAVLGIFEASARKKPRAWAWTFPRRRNRTATTDRISKTPIIAQTAQAPRAADRARPARARQRRGRELSCRRA